MDPRMSVRSKSLAKDSRDHCWGSSVAPWPKTDSPGALKAAMRGSTRGPTSRIATTTSTA